MSAVLPKALGGALAFGGAAAVYMQFFNIDPAVEAAMPPEVKASKLKKTLSAGGMLPQPEAKGSKLKSTPSGSMAVFTQGGDAALNKGTGEML